MVPGREDEKQRKIYQISGEFPSVSAGLTSERNIITGVVLRETTHTLRRSKLMVQHDGQCSRRSQTTYSLRFIHTSRLFLTIATVILFTSCALEGPYFSLVRKRHICDPHHLNCDQIKTENEGSESPGLSSGQISLLY
jgi:hypothetical protein